MHSICFCIRWT